MHELVHSALHSRLLSALKLPSFAGEGLPERMRSISFALLGLTAAAGLALVALFAQPSFPLLSPVPLPAEPSASESIADARKLPPDQGSVALVTALPAPVRRAGGRESTGTTSPETPVGSSDSGAGGEGSPQVPAGAVTPAPTGVPHPSGGGGGAEPGNGGAGGSDPTPAAAPAQPTPKPSAPAPSPQPTAPKPEAVAPAPKPEPAPAPGNSSSAAAVEHASERGIEASASAGPPTAAAVAPEATPSPGNGDGLAKGHDK